MTPFTHPILALHSSQAELHFRCYMALHHWLQQKERSDLIFFWTESCLCHSVRPALLLLPETICYGKSYVHAASVYFL